VEDLLLLFHPASGASLVVGVNYKFILYRDSLWIPKAPLKAAPAMNLDPEVVTSSSTGIPPSAPSPYVQSRRPNTTRKARPDRGASGAAPAEVDESIVKRPFCFGNNRIVHLTYDSGLFFQTLTDCVTKGRGNGTNPDPPKDGAVGSSAVNDRGDREVGNVNLLQREIWLKNFQDSFVEVAAYFRRISYSVLNNHAGDYTTASVGNVDSAMDKSTISPNETPFSEAKMSTPHRPSFLSRDKEHWLIPIRERSLSPALVPRTLSRVNEIEENEREPLRASSNIFSVSRATSVSSSGEGLRGVLLVDSLGKNEDDGGLRPYHISRPIESSNLKWIGNPGPKESSTSIRQPSEANDSSLSLLQILERETTFPEEEVTAPTSGPKRREQPTSVDPPVPLVIVTFGELSLLPWEILFSGPMSTVHTRDTHRSGDVGAHWNENCLWISRKHSLLSACQLQQVHNPLLQRSRLNSSSIIDNRNSSKRPLYEGEAPKRSSRTSSDSSYHAPLAPLELGTVGTLAGEAAGGASTPAGESSLNAKSGAVAHRVHPLHSIIGLVNTPGAQNSSSFRFPESTMSPELQQRRPASYNSSVGIFAEINNISDWLTSLFHILKLSNQPNPIFLPPIFAAFSMTVAPAVATETLLEDRKLIWRLHWIRSNEDGILARLLRRDLIHDSRVHYNCGRVGHVDGDADQALQRDLGFDAQLNRGDKEDFTNIYESLFYDIEQSVDGYM